MLESLISRSIIPGSEHRPAAAVRDNDKSDVPASAANFSDMKRLDGRPERPGYEVVNYEGAHRNITSKSNARRPLMSAGQSSGSAAVMN